MSFLKKIFFKRVKFFKEDLNFKVNFIKKDIEFDTYIKDRQIMPDVNMKELQYEIKTDIKERNKLIDIQSNIEKKDFSYSRKIKFIKKNILFIFFLILVVTSNSSEIFEGIDYYDKKFKNDNGPQVAHIIKIKKTSLYNLRVVLSDFRLKHRQPLSKICKKYNALIGINAAYFSWTGQPLGTVILNHKIVSLPIYKRTLFCIDDNGTVSLERPDIIPSIKINDKEYKVHGINQKKYKDKIMVYTPEYGRSTLTEELGIEISVINNRIMEISSRNAVIPPNGYVVAIHNEVKDEIMNEIDFFDNIQMNIFKDKKLENIRYAIGGGPLLLKDGRIKITSLQEKFKPNLVYQKAPRTGVGLNKDGDIIIISLDGRQKGYSVGMDLKEFAQLFKDTGAIHAMNLDGGGSTTLVINGNVMNRPSDGSERKINGAIIIEKK